MPKRDLDPGRQAGRIALLLLTVLFLTSCDSSDKITPPSSDIIPVRIMVDVSPDWVDAGWLVRHLPHDYEGARDSVLVLPDDGEYLLMAGTTDDLHLPNEQEFQRGDVAPGDSLSFHLQYSQVPWQARYSETGPGFWYDVMPLDHGGILVAGEQGRHPRVAVLDRNGVVQWDEITADNGLFSQILPLGEAGYLLGGHGAEGILLSNRGSAGEELWWQCLELGGHASFAGIMAHGVGEYLLLASVIKDDGPIYPALVALDGAGQIQDRINMVGMLNRVPAGLAPRIGGGAFILQARQLKEGSLNYQAEVVLVDEVGAVEQTLEFGTCEPGNGSSILGLADGGVVVCYLTHDLSDDLGSTEVVRLSNTGMTLWHISLDIDGFEHLAACRESFDGRILMAGNGHLFQPVTFQTWLVELDAEGRELRNMTSNTSPDRTLLWSACWGWDEGLFLTGGYGDPASAENEAWVVRTDQHWFIPLATRTD